MTEQYDRRHGGPFDRGGADCYYRRAYQPHYYVEGSYTSERVDKLTEQEKAAYQAGWLRTENLGDFKDYG